MTDSPAPRRGRPRADEQDGLRDRMLDAAVALFRANGFAGTSIEAVARMAGVTKRTVYVYFTNKTGLFTAAVERQHGYLVAHSTEHTSIEQAATEVVRSLHSDDAIGLHRLVLAEAVRFPDLAQSFYANGPEQSIAYLAAILRATRPTDNTIVDSPARPEDLAQSLYSLLLGEPHRQRMLGLRSAPDAAESHNIAQDALLALNLDGLIRN